MSVTVRQARLADLDAIVALLSDDGIGRGRERPGNPVYAEAFARMEAQDGNVYLVAETGGVVVGCLQFTLIHGLSRAGMSRVQIEGVRVKAAHRGTGIGRMLLEGAFERGRRAGAGLVQLTTDRTRDGALLFYERLGFVASHHGMKRTL